MTTKTKALSRCKGCGKLQKRTAHLYNEMCPRCYAAYAVGKAELVGGRSGVTNTQLLIAISANINDVTTLTGLKGNYPNMFVNAVRYLRAGERKLIEGYFGNVQAIDARQLELINLIKPGRSGVSGSKILPVMEQAIEAKDADVVDALLEYYPELVRNQARYLHARNRRALEAYVDAKNQAVEVTAHA